MTSSPLPPSTSSKIAIDTPTSTLNTTCKTQPASSPSIFQSTLDISTFHTRISSIQFNSSEVFQRCKEKIESLTNDLDSLHEDIFQTVNQSRIKRLCHGLNKLPYTSEFYYFSDNQIHSSEILLL